MKNFKKYLGKKVKAVIDVETGEAIETVLKLHKETDTVITNCGFVVVDIK